MSRKKERKHALDQEKKRRKWKTQIRIKDLASFLDIFNLVE